MELVFDIETNFPEESEYFDKVFSLVPTEIYCIVAIDENNTQYTFDILDGNVQEGLAFLQKADKLIGHNIIGFDMPVIKRLTNTDLWHESKVLDTLVLSRLLNPSREGGHSMKIWGDKLNCPKGTPPEDFNVYTKKTLEYCIQDVVVTKKLFEFLKTEAGGFSKESILLEHKASNILQEQQVFGFKFNVEKATFLLSNLNCKIKQVEEEVHRTFKPRWLDVKYIEPKLKNDGTLSKVGLNAEEYAQRQPTNCTRPFHRKELVQFNLGSRKQIGEYLIEFGWKPKNFTPTGQAIVDEGTLKKITHIKEAKLIADYLLYQKRIAQVKSWIDALAQDRVHGSVICTGAITGRMSHHSPNMAQVPSVKSPFGKECRDCWTVEKGNKLVGIDASGLELRLLAHYMADEEYTNEIINGDIHATNQKLGNLESRDTAKTFIYALIYGAGDEKLGSIVGGSRTSGKRARESFLANNVSFRRLKERVEVASKKQYLKGLDGRKMFIRHRHASLNTLLQGAGAVVMKKALILLHSKLDLNGISAKFVANIHDEWQIEVPEKNADAVGSMAVRCIEEASAHFNLRCPLTGEYKIGESWYETH